MSSEFELVELMDDQSIFTKRKDRALLEISEVMHSAFSTNSGKRALNILSIKYFAQECFDEKNPDPYLAAKRDGQRSVLKFIYDQMGAYRGKT